MDKQAVINELFKKLLGCKPKFDNSYSETKLYITDVRCIIADLKSYDIDLVAEVAAKALISY